MKQWELLALAAAATAGLGALLFFNKNNKGGAAEAFFTGGGNCPPGSMELATGLCYDLTGYGNYSAGQAYTAPIYEQQYSQYGIPSFSSNDTYGYQPYSTEFQFQQYQQQQPSSYYYYPQQQYYPSSSYPYQQYQQYTYTSSSPRQSCIQQCRQMYYY